MDTDGDGTVGVAELQARQALDTNKDGTVSEEEVRFFLSGAESFDRETFRLSGYLLLRPYLTQDPEKEEEAGQPPQEGEADRASGTQACPGRCKNHVRATGRGTTGPRDGTRDKGLVHETMQHGGSLMATTDMNVRDRSRPMTAEERKVILASSAGTIFNGTTSTCMARLPPSSGRSSSRHSRKQRGTSLRCWPSPPDSSCAPLARWSLVRWVT